MNGQKNLLLHFIFYILYYTYTWHIIKICKWNVNDAKYDRWSHIKAVVSYKKGKTEGNPQQLKSGIFRISFCLDQQNLSATRQCGINKIQNRKYQDQKKTTFHSLNGQSFIAHIPFCKIWRTHKTFCQIKLSQAPRMRSFCNFQRATWNAYN